MSADPLRLIAGKSQREKAIEIARKHRPDMKNLKTVQIDAKTYLMVAKDRDPDEVRKLFAERLELNRIRLIRSVQNSLKIK